MNTLTIRQIIIAPVVAVALACAVVAPAGLALRSLLSTHQDTVQPRGQATPMVALAASVREVSAFHPTPVVLGRRVVEPAADFQGYQDVAEKKRAFFNYLLPMIRSANQEIMNERAWLLAMRDRLLEGGMLGTHELDALARYERRYSLRGRHTTAPARIAELI